MEPKEIVESLRALPDAGRRRLLDRVGRIARESRFFYHERENHPVSLAPIVVDRGTASVLRSLTRAVFRFQSRAPELYRGNVRGFADLIRLERRTRAWFDATCGPATTSTLLIRPDFGMAFSGRGLKPVLYESNSLMLGSLYLQPVTQRIVETCALGGRSGRQSLGLTAPPDLLALLGRWLAAGRGRGPRGGLLALLENLPPGGGFSELPEITRSLAGAGGGAAHADPRRLELRRGEVLWKGKPVAYAYRDFSFEDVGGPDNARMKPFRALWERGVVAPGFAADFDQKGILECFTSEAFDGLFTREEARLFREHVLWTRVVGERRTRSAEGRTVDLPEYILKFREHLVLKPSWSSGGEGILIGPSTSEGRWRRGLERALKTPGGFAVQSYASTQKHPTAFLRDGELRFADCNYTIGVFYGGREFGFAARVSARDIVNVARGGAMSAVYFR